MEWRRHSGSRASRATRSSTCRAAQRRVSEVVVDLAMSFMRHTQASSTKGQERHERSFTGSLGASAKQNDAQFRTCVVVPPHNDVNLVPRRQFEPPASVAMQPPLGRTGQGGDRERPRSTGRSRSRSRSRSRCRQRAAPAQAGIGIIGPGQLNQHRQTHKSPPRQRHFMERRSEDCSPPAGSGTAIVAVRRPSPSRRSPRRHTVSSGERPTSPPQQERTERTRRKKFPLSPKRDLQSRFSDEAGPLSALLPWVDADAGREPAKTLDTACGRLDDVLGRVTSLLNAVAHQYAVENIAPTIVQHAISAPAMDTANANADTAADQLASSRYPNHPAGTNNAIDDSDGGMLIAERPILEDLKGLERQLGQKQSAQVINLESDLHRVYALLPLS